MDSAEKLPRNSTISVFTDTATSPWNFWLATPGQLRSWSAPFLSFLSTMAIISRYYSLGVGAVELRPAALWFALYFPLGCSKYRIGERRIAFLNV